MGNIRLTLQVAATFVGTVVGAGFATGREIVQFFTQYGAWGTNGIVVSGILFIFAGSKLMITAQNIGARSYKDLNVFLFGPVFGAVMNGLVLFVLFGSSAVMLSGAGAVFHEQLGWPWQAGLFLTTVLCFLALLNGLKGVMAVNAFVVPVMIVFTLFAAGVQWTASHDNALTPPFPFHSGRLSWLISALSYASFNLFAAQAVLVPLGHDIRDKQAIKNGGRLGGLLLMVLLLVSHWTLSGHPDTVFFQIPMAEVIRTFGMGIHLLFLAVIFGEIFTTLIGNIYGVKRYLAQRFSIREPVLTALLLGLIYPISQFGYGPLLSNLYPLFGYLSLVFLLFVLLKKSGS
jgi:uncharacterized membrane protein YkvI